MSTKHHTTETLTYEDQITKEIDRICSDGGIPIPLKKRGKNPNCPKGGFEHLMTLESPVKTEKGYRIGDVAITFNEGQLPLLVYPEGMYDQDEWEFKNVGMALQASKKWVLDIETKEAYFQLKQYLVSRGIDPSILESTYTVMSGSEKEGKHIYYNSPFLTATVPKSKKPFGLDDLEIKCSGQMVRPPSVHPSGNSYTCSNDLPYQDAPDWLIEEIEKHRTASSESTSSTSSKSAGEKTFIRSGERDTTFFSRARSLAKQGYPQKATLSALEALNTPEFCEVPMGNQAGDRNLEDIVNQAYKYETGEFWTSNGHSDNSDFFSPHTDRGFGEKEKQLPVMSFDNFLEEAGTEVDWLIESVLARGELTAFSGRGKLAGKTTFWCHAISACARGEDHAGFYTTPVKCLYLTEQGNNFVEALSDAGLDKYKDHISILAFKDVSSLKWHEIINQSASWCAQNGYDVLIVDTFATFSRLRGSEENESGPVGDRMRTFRLAVQKNNIAGLLIRHSGKDNIGRGSSAFEDESDIVIDLSRPEGSHSPTVRRLSIFGRHGEMIRNIQLHEGRYVSLGSDNKIEFNKAVDFIKDLLKDCSTVEKGMKTPEIQKRGTKDGHSKTTLDRALKWLDENGEIRSQKRTNLRGHPRYYFMPSVSPQTSPLYEEEETEEKDYT